MQVIKPAELALLAIYNPSLGRSDETLHDQIVYYYSKKSSESRKQSGDDGRDHAREEANEKLRQIGLAQGMVEFAKAFSDGAAVNAVDSEKSRILMHELESGWWLLASINLTRIQTKANPEDSKSEANDGEPRFEYSAREVCPQSLLLQHLLKAHSVFLLHHAPSLADLYVRLTRAKFCAALERFWNKFVKDWDVLIHGAPAVDVFDGLKLAAGGELGIGVGEEEWGSGEREVLEGFIGRTDGLIDLVVARFGDLQGREEAGNPVQQTKDAWIGSGSFPGSSDGVVFSGIHGVTRHSLMAIAKWMEWVFRKGQAAYGVRDNPHAPRRKRRRKEASLESGEGDPIGRNNRTPSKSDNADENDIPHGIPPPIVTAANKSLQTALKHEEERRDSASPETKNVSAGGTDVLMKYMTFGLYGSGWGLPASESSNAAANEKERNKGGASSHSKQVEGTQTSRNQETERVHRATEDRKFRDGRFLIGLQGDLDDEGETEEDSGTDSGGENHVSRPKGWNNRILLRTVHVERRTLQSEGTGNNPHEGPQNATLEYFDRVQVIVYVRQPFIFIFLFELQTPSLNYTSFYRSIHHQLGPLQRPLLRSTSTSAVYSRLYDTVSPTTVTPVDSKQPIFDLVYDPLNLTVHTTIPPIAEAGDVTLGQDGTTLWSRLDALNVHYQIVSTFDATRRHLSELERTAKTSRGWWIVWIRLPTGQPNLYREAFLVRKATDYVDQNSSKSSFGFGKDSGIGWTSSAGKIAEGIGIDTRRYVEGLLHLNR